MKRSFAAVHAFMIVSACGQSPDHDLAGPVQIVDDAAPLSLTGEPGNANRGLVEFISRDGGHCVLCHAIRGLEVEFQGNVGPPLTDVGSRLTAGQIRYRIVDAQRVWPETVMPSYFRTGGLNQVGQEFQGKPALTGQQIEDIVAFLEKQTS